MRRAGGAGAWRRAMLPHGDSAGLDGEVVQADAASTASGSCYFG